jgi:predicted nucleotidyltransferase
MTLDSIDKKFIVETVRKFFSDPNDKIILFGSFAKGVARPSSDIDIAIKSQNPLPLAAWQELISSFEESSFLKSVDVVDYRRVSEDFQKIIDRDGVDLEKVGHRS